MMVVGRPGEAPAGGARDFAAAVGATTLGARRLRLGSGETATLPPGDAPFEGYVLVLEGEVRVGDGNGGLALVVPGCAWIARAVPFELRAVEDAAVLLLWTPLAAVPHDGMASLRLPDVRRRRGVRDIGGALGARHATLMLLEIGQASRHALREPAAAEELYLVSRGTGRVVTDEDDEALAAGDVLLRTPGDPPGRFEAARTDELGMLVFSPYARPL